MAAPTYLSNGAYNRTLQATNISMLVVCPASVSAGNLLLLAYGQRGTSATSATTFTGPAGWTAVGTTLSRNFCTLLLWRKTADGSESSLTQTIVITSGGPGAVMNGVIWMFDANAQSIEGIATVVGGVTTISAADVVVGGVDRLGVDVMLTQNAGTLSATLGGSTGGTWLRQNYGVAAANCTLFLYTADLAAGANITSGSSTGAGASNWLSEGFALYAAGAAPINVNSAGAYGAAIAYGGLPLICPVGF